jgi:hypothetical protein
MQIHLRTIEQLFNTLDPSPFHERDLDADAEDFLVGWASELPHRQELHLVLEVEALPAAGGSDASHAWVGEAIRHYFAGRALATRQVLRHLLRKGRITLTIGCVFLLACLTLAHALSGVAPGSLWHGALRESLSIGGWVAMWQPLQIYLYDWWPVREQLALYRRLSLMPVEVVAVPGRLTGVNSRAVRAG